MVLLLSLAHGSRGPALPGQPPALSVWHVSVVSRSDGRARGWASRLGRPSRRSVPPCGGRARPSTPFFTWPPDDRLPPARCKRRRPESSTRGSRNFWGGPAAGNKSRRRLLSTPGLADCLAALGPAWRGGRNDGTFSVKRRFTMAGDRWSDARFQDALKSRRHPGDRHDRAARVGGGARPKVERVSVGRGLTARKAIVST